MKRLIRKILREELNKSDRHYRRLDIISEHIQLPYFDSMEGLTIDEKDDQEYIMKKILGYNVKIKGKYIYDDKGNNIYYEHSNGSWEYWGFDARGKMIYREVSGGYWEKWEYGYGWYPGTLIYYEDITGVKLDKRKGGEHSVFKPDNL